MSINTLKTSLHNNHAINNSHANHSTPVPSLRAILQKADTDGMKGLSAKEVEKLESIYISEVLKQMRSGSQFFKAVSGISAVFGAVKSKDIAASPYLAGLNTPSANQLNTQKLNQIKEYVAKNAAEYGCEQYPIDELIDECENLIF